MPLTVESLQNILVILAMLLVVVLLYGMIEDIYVIALILFAGILLFIILAP